MSESPQEQTEQGETYDPLKDDTYMSPQMLEYFRNKLNRWKAELLEQSQSTIERLRTSERQADPLDSAQQESDYVLELRSKDRDLKLIKKIDNALGRIETGDYGYCLDTDEEIGVKRLIARPVAEYTLESQELLEAKRKTIKKNHWGYENAKI